MDISEGCDNGSHLTKSCEVANVEVDLSSLDQPIECFNEDENCERIVAELNPNHESDDGECENEDIRDIIELTDLKESLPSITRHRALASGNEHTW